MSAAPDLLIVESVTRKRGTAGPARDVYDSRLWAARRRHAEARSVPWAILSARHALLDPDEPIEPYALQLGELDDATFDAVAARAIEQLASRGPLRGRVVEAHVRAAYGDRLAPAISAQGGRLEQPLRGLGVCGQLAWYRGETVADGDACALADAD
jgi:hypothetical protein